MEQARVTVEHQACVDAEAEQATVDNCFDTRSFFSLETQDSFYKLQAEQRLTINFSNKKFINNMVIYMIDQM